jgi:phage terminase large subunit-like protein
MTGKYKGFTYRTHPFIEAYWGLIDGGLEVCREQHQLRDYLVGRLAEPGVFIDADRINGVVAVKERYFYPMWPFQKFIDCFVHGVYVTDGGMNGVLMFNRYMLMMGRGNGKNGYISPNAWYFATKRHGIRGYNVEIVANSEKQVKTSFDDVVGMLEDPATDGAMRRAFYWTKEEVRSRSTGSVIRWHTSNAKTKDSLRSGCVVFDEVHQYEDYDRINVFTTGLGKVPGRREFMITTDGFVRGRVLDDLKQDAADTFKGERPHNRTFFFICKLDEKDEIDRPDMWVKANPALPYMPELGRTIAQEYEDSKYNPELRRGFATKRMNMPSQDTVAVVTDWENVLATNQPVPDLAGWLCIGAVDYAETTDYVGCGLLFRKGAKYIWLHHSYVCNASLLKARPKFPIEEAVARGLCTVVYEPFIPAELVAGWFVEQAKKYAVQWVATDLFREAVIKSAFAAAGIPLAVVRKGPYTHMKIAPLIDVLFAEKNIVFGDDMMMRWYVSNTCKAYDKKGNTSYEKIEPVRRKTDGFHAFLTAMSSEFENPLPNGEAVRYEDVEVYVY